MERIATIIYEILTQGTETIFSVGMALTVSILVAAVVTGLVMTGAIFLTKKFSLRNSDETALGHVKHAYLSNKSIDDYELLDNFFTEEEDDPSLTIHEKETVNV